MNGLFKNRHVGGQHSPAINLKNIITDQRGTALVISLIMLVVLSLLGVLALDTSETELGISANHRANVETFNVAERGVELARAVISAGDAVSGYTLNSTDISQIEAGRAYGSLTSGSITAIDLGNSKGCPPDIGSADAECGYFRIEVTAEGAKGSEVSLETQVAEEITVGESNRFNM